MGNSAGLSVGLMEPSGRVDKITTALKTTGTEVIVDPANPADVDILMYDKPSRELAEAIIRYRLGGPSVVYRMRGDFYIEYGLEGLSRVRQWLAIKVILPQLDGAIAVCPMFARMLSERSRVAPVGVATLPIEVNDWPMVTHEEDQLELVTLTNANYRGKIDPLIEHATAVDSWLERTGGHWRIGGRGSYKDDLSRAVAGLDNVEFDGFIDSGEALRTANCMLHLSNLDGLPNSILEGMAAGLPVITNDFPSFVEYGWPITVVSGSEELLAALETARSPGWRMAVGEAGRTHVEQNHSPEAVGREYVRCFERIRGDK